MTDTAAPLGHAIARTHWPMPAKAPRSGAYVDLKPMSEADIDSLWPVARGAPESFTYLRYGPFAGRDDLARVLEDLANRPDQPFWTVQPKGSRPCGWLSICDIHQTDGSIEIGSIWFAPELQGTRAGREAIFLLMCHALDELAYERLAWRCQAQNAKSFKAAENLGFAYEGTWRRAAVIDGWQRDVAWFSILRDEWPSRKTALEHWLLPENFDRAGQPIRSLGHIRAALASQPG